MPGKQKQPKSGKSAIKKKRPVQAPKKGVSTQNFLVPAAMGKVVQGLGRPNVRRVGDVGDVVVIHREYISDLVASAAAAAFQVAGIPINPANSFLFPWLSGIAKNFESYVFSSLKFLFEPTCGSETPGAVLMAVDYDVSDALPADKQEMMSYRDATRSNFWVKNAMSCGKEDLHKRKTYYTDDGNDLIGGYPAGELQEFLSQAREDPRLNDVGEFLIATSNSDANAVAGEIYVEYECRLLTPKEDESEVELWTMFQDNATGVGMTKASPFGSETLTGSIAPAIYPGLPIFYGVSGGSSALYFQEAGSYMVVPTLQQWEQSGAAGTGNYSYLEATPGSNCTFHAETQGRTFCNGTTFNANLSTPLYITINSGAPLSHADVIYMGSLLLSVVDAGTGSLDPQATPSSSAALLRISRAPVYLQSANGPYSRIKLKGRAGVRSMVERRISDFDLAGKRQLLKEEKESTPKGEPAKAGFPLGVQESVPRGSRPSTVENGCIFQSGNSHKVALGRVRMSHPPPTVGT